MHATLSGVSSLATGQSGPLQQLYVTYCHYGEGILPGAGFTVRASSTRDPLLVRFAQEYPLYELPEVTTPEASPGFEMPDRLALVRVPGGPGCLIHSVPLPAEGGRVNNFFSHVVIRPLLTPRDALMTWGSPDWIAGCSPDTRLDLSPLAELPVSGTLNDQVVTEFLQPTLLEQGASSASFFCPDRLIDDGIRRRELLSGVLQGCLAAIQAGPGSLRGRFYIRAEPRLTALLLYAAVRILPPPLVANMTFSTYENTRRALRAYRHAQIVGTWSGDQAEELEDAYFTSRGYALDTVSQRISPELRQASDSLVAEWIELALHGDWKTLDKVYALVGDTAGSLISVPQAFKAARLTQTLVSGRAETRDLLALKQSSNGQALLLQHSEKVRSVLLSADLADPELERELADFLPESELLALEGEVAQALQGANQTDWRPPWRLVKMAIRANPARLRETLQRILPPPPFPSGLRLSFLQEVRDLQLPASYQRQALHGLLRGCTRGELQAFASSSLPLEWFAWALYYALLRAETQPEAIRLLLGGNDDLLRAFWEQLAYLKDERQRMAILGPLLIPPEGAGALLLSRSLQNRCTFRPDTLTWLLEELNVFGPNWFDFWKRDNNLAHLLEVLISFRKEVNPIWDRLFQRIDTNLLMGDPYQKVLLLGLVAAKQRAGGTMLERVDQLITDWSMLREYFVAATAVTGERKQEIINILKRLAIDPVGLLGHYFERFLSPQEISGELVSDFGDFFQSFYPEASWFEDHEVRFSAWLEVVRSCPLDANRARYQGYYLKHCIPDQLRQRLAEEAIQAKKLLPEALEPMPSPPTPTIQSEPAPSPPIVQVSTAGEDLVFDATGISERRQITLAAFLQVCVWILPSVFGGGLALLLFSIGKLPARTVAVVAPFLPLVIAMAEGIALQACVLSRESIRQGKRGRACVGMLGMGTCLGIAVSTLAGGLALAFGMPLMTMVWLGVTVFAGVLSGVGSGIALPLLLSAARLSPRIASGPLARAVASVFATGLFIALAHSLLR